MSASRDLPGVRLRLDDGVATVTIDNPPVNVLSAAVLDSLLGTLARVKDETAARVVVLDSAAPKAFAAGANIREMAPMGPNEARIHGGRGQSVTVAIEDLPLPVIAAVHGSCLGGGTEIALACDFVVASEDAVFGQPEINLGVMPGWGGTRRLPRRVGLARARRWILLGDPVPAKAAHAAGWIDDVVPRAELPTRARELARTLRGKSSLALAAAKSAINRAIDPGRAEGLAYELDLWAQLFGTPDQREGMQAFIQKRAWTPMGRDSWAEYADRFPWGAGAPHDGAKGKKRDR